MDEQGASVDGRHGWRRLLRAGAWVLSLGLVGCAASSLDGEAVDRTPLNPATTELEDGLDGLEAGVAGTASTASPSSRATPWPAGSSRAPSTRSSAKWGSRTSSTRTTR